MKSFFKLKNLKNYANYAAVALVLIVFVILTFAGGVKGTTTSLLEEMSIKIILAVSLSLVVGFLGELSLGHAGFMCIGAYISGKLACILEPHLAGSEAVNLIICLFVGGIVAAICGVIMVSLPSDFAVTILR